jgi:hypothetical protein
LGDVVYEPDAAVIRAGLVGAVAAIVGGALLDPRIAYVTGELVPTPFARAYRVVEEVPFREKALRAALRERESERSRSRSAASTSCRRPCARG